MWWESDTGSLYIYYNDGDSSQWVMLVPGNPGVPKVIADLNMQGFSILNLLNLNGSPAANLWFTDPRFLAAANGYFVLPILKLGIQWGSVAGGADNAVTFPIPFAAAPYAVVATAVGTLTAAQVVTDMVTNVTATGFTCQPRYTSVPVAGTQGQVTVGIAGQGANWIAVGRFP
jgi:streptogramin lyase